MINKKLVIQAEVENAQEAKELLSELEVLYETYDLEIVVIISSQASFG